MLCMHAVKHSMHVHLLPSPRVSAGSRAQCMPDAAACEGDAVHACSEAF